MEEKKLGIENLKKVCSVIATLAGVGDAMGHTKGVERWNQLLGVGGAIRSLNGLDLKQVLPEIKDLDAVERAQVLELFQKELDLKDDDLEAVVEEGLGIAADLASIIERSKALYEKAKAV